MPGRDRTGPMGYGPLTGRRAGLCVPAGVPEYGYPSPFYGRGRGLGCGPRAIPPWTYMAQQPPVTQRGEAEYLEGEVQFLKGELEKMESRLQELKDRD